MAQEIEHLPSKYKFLNSNLSTAKINKKPNDTNNKISCLKWQNQDGGSRGS
jgi:hypothetical protein